MEATEPGHDIYVRARRVENRIVTVNVMEEPN